MNDPIRTQILRRWMDAADRIVARMTADGAPADLLEMAKENAAERRARYEAEIAPPCPCKEYLHDGSLVCYGCPLMLEA